MKNSLLITAGLFLFAGPLAPASTFALAWYWSNPAPHGNNIVDMASNGSLAVQVAELGQLYTGLNFAGWLPQNSGTTNDLQAVTFFGNRIVIVGANGTVGYSDDGAQFTATSINLTDPTDWLVDVAASPSLVVTVGDEAVICSSSDGATWQLQDQPPGVGGNWLLSVAWGNGVFAITGEGGYVATSSDGIHWTNHSPTSVTTDDLMRVRWVATTNTAAAFPYTGFWAVSYSGAAIYSTNNGTTWHSFSTGSTNILYDVSANDTYGLLAGDSDVQLGFCTNGTTVLWRPQVGQAPDTAPNWTYYSSLWDPTNEIFWLVGDAGMMVQGTPGTNDNYSCDWSEAYPDNAYDWLWQVTQAGDLYVAVGDNTRIMTSQNGVDWSIEAIPLTNSVASPANTNVFLCVGGDTNLLIAAGNHGCLSISPNRLVPVTVTNLDGTLFTNLVSSLGVLWNSMPAPAQTTNDLAGVGQYGTNYFLAGDNATLLRSSDGTNWTRVTLPVSAVTTNFISGLAASSNLMVATGDQGLILTSPDGATWTNHSYSTSNWLFRVRYLNGTFLAVGENGFILTSTNGTSWSPKTSGTGNWLNDAVMISNTCYIVGNNGTVLASTNFLNWTNLGTITLQSLYGAATQNGQLVVVGLQGSILRSQVIPDLSPIQFISYAQSDGDNVFSVAGDPDQQFTLDSSTNLVNWTTGPPLDLIYGSGTLVFYTQLGTNPPPCQYYRATLAP
jgi:hypothetical protein